MFVCAISCTGARPRQSSWTSGSWGPTTVSIRPICTVLMRTCSTRAAHVQHTRHVSLNHRPCFVVLQCRHVPTPTHAASPVGHIYTHAGAPRGEGPCGECGDRP